MSHKQGSLLAQIEAGVLDENVSLASLLQTCIVLGGRANSEKMRDWARQELNGYKNGDEIPPYRRVPTGLQARITNSAGYNGRTQRVIPEYFPDQVREFLDEKGIELEVAVLGEGIGKFEAMAASDKPEHLLLPWWADIAAQSLNTFNMPDGSRVEAVYWPLAQANLHSLLVGVRTALAELIAELLALTPDTQDIPNKAAADQAVNFVITGNRATVHVATQQALDGGTNVAVAPSDGGAVTVAGAGTAIGSQTASGTGSTIVGTQTASGDHNTIAGRDGPAGDVDGQGWWARLRKRGWIVALSTVLACLFGLGSLVFAAFTWLGWTPWWR